MTKDIYEACPILQSEHFTIRLIEKEDSEDLLKCYSDPKAQKFFNDDNCDFPFVFDNLKSMSDCIDYWLRIYENKGFVRFSIIDNQINQVVGTIEMFGKDDKYGVLRLDISSKYEKLIYLRQIINICKQNFFELFHVDNMITKAIPEADNRISALSEFGFEPYEIPNSPYKDYFICKK